MPLPANVQMVRDNSVLSARAHALISSIKIDNSHVQFNARRTHCALDMRVCPRTLRAFEFIGKPDGVPISHH